MATFNTTLQLDEPMEVVQIRLVASVTGALSTSNYQRQYQVSAQPGLIVLIRRYRPGWAIILGIVGIFVFFIGLLFFLIKNSESLTISLSPRSEGGCTVVIGGQAQEFMILAVQRGLTGPTVSSAAAT